MMAAASALFLQMQENLPISGNDFPRHCDYSPDGRVPPKKRGGRMRRRTAGRIERGGGNGGDPVWSPPGWLEVSPAGRT